MQMSEGIAQAPQLTFEDEVNRELTVIQDRLRTILDRQNGANDATYRFSAALFGERPRGNRCAETDSAKPPACGLCGHIMSELSHVRALLAAIDEGQDEWGHIFHTLEGTLIAPNVPTPNVEFATMQAKAAQAMAEAKAATVYGRR